MKVIEKEALATTVLWLLTVVLLRPHPQSERSITQHGPEGTLDLLYA